VTTFGHFFFFFLFFSSSFFVIGRLVLSSSYQGMDLVSGQYHYHDFFVEFTPTSCFTFMRFAGIAEFPEPHGVSTLGLTFAWRAALLRCNSWRMQVEVARRSGWLTLQNDVEHT